MISPSEAIKSCVDSSLRGIHTAMPGIVVAYDPSTNKATIQPALNKNYTSGPKVMPILENVPIMFAGGSAFNVTFPVKKGDYVLLIFMERSIDLWKSVGGQVTPNDSRMFHLSDAIAIPGLQPFTGNFSSNNGSDLVISYGGSEIRIKENGDILIKTSSKVSIGGGGTEVLDVIHQILGILKNPEGVTVTVSGTSGVGGYVLDELTLIALETAINNLKGPIP